MATPSKEAFSELSSNAKWSSSVSTFQDLREGARNLVLRDLSDHLVGLTGRGGTDASTFASRFRGVATGFPFAAR